mgnify:CR=1 FL=1
MWGMQLPVQSQSRIFVDEWELSAGPPEVLAVAESGVRTPEDARRLRAAGAPNLLVGEALVTAPDMAARVRELSSQPREG